MGAARTHHLTQVCVGLALLMTGFCGMAALIAVTYGDSAASQAWALRLGLTLSLLLSAMAQTLVLFGGWLVWRSRRRAR